MLVLPVSTRWPLPSSLAVTAPLAPRPEVPLIAASIEDKQFARRDRDRVAGGTDVDQQVASSLSGGGQRDRTGRRRRRRRCGLLRLLHSRQGLFEQAGQAGEAVIGRIERLLTLADLVEQSAQIVGAVIQRLRGEIGGRIVEGSVDLLAGRQMLLGRGQVGGGILQRKQVLPNAGAQSDVGHGTRTFWLYAWSQLLRVTYSWSINRIGCTLIVIYYP